MLSSYRRLLRSGYARYGRSRTNLVVGLALFVLTSMAVSVAGVVFVIKPWFQMFAPHLAAPIDDFILPLALYTIAAVAVLSLGGSMLLWYGVLRPIERHMQRLRTKLADSTPQEIKVLSHWAEKRQAQLKAALDENKRLRREVRENSSRISDRAAEVAALVGFSSEPLILIDTDSRITDITAATCETLSWRRDEAIGRYFDDVVNLFDQHKERPREYPLKGIPGNVMGAQSALPHIEQALILHRSGRELKGMVVVSTILDQTGSATGAIVRVVVEGAASGVSKELAAGLPILPVGGASAPVMISGLKTRDLFDRRLEELLERARTQKAEHALLLLRFDQLSSINERFGFLAVEETSWRLGRDLRDHFAQSGDCYQLSWDRFAVLIGFCAIDRATEQAESLRQRIASRQYAWKDEHFSTTVSVALLPITETSDGRTHLMETAERTLCRATRLGGNTVSRPQDDGIGEQQRLDDAQWLAWVEPRLNTSLAHVVSQEISPLKPGGLPLLECFLRIEDDDGVWVTPDAFRAPVERQGKTASIDLWMLRTVLEQLEQRPTLVEQFESFHLNLSVASLDNPDFIPRVVQVIRGARLPASKICFEIQEHDVPHNGLRLRAFAETLRENGVRLLLDHCRVGLGLEILRDLPVHGFKIDEGLVAQALTNPVARAQLEWLCTTARLMKLSTVACGVDDAEALLTLKPLGFDYLQGSAVNRMGPLVI